MKRTVRLFSLLLAVLMLCTTAVVLVGAEETDEAPTVMEQLGWKYSDPDNKIWALQNKSQKLSISNAMGTNNKSLYIESLGGTGWCGMDIVDAAKMTGITQYVVRMQVAWSDAAHRVTFLLNRPDGLTTSAGDWAGINGTTRVEHSHYTIEGTNNVEAQTAIDTVKKEGFNDLAVAVDLTAGKVDVYFNDMTTPKGTIVTDYTAASRIIMVVNNCEAFVDNISVVKGTMTTVADSENTVYSEDFEKYDLNQEEVFIRPTVDYTGKQTGEIVFKDDYNAATRVEQFYYKTVMNTGFSAPATIEYSADGVNGTPCAKVTGKWSLVEIIPAEAVTPYSTYTIHMTVKMISNTGRFTLFYNTPDNTNTKNCGFFEMRGGAPITIRNQGIVNGTSNAYKDTATKLSCGDNGVTYNVAISIDCNSGTTYSYINGEFFDFAAGINKAQSAVHLVVENAVGCVDDVMITNGTYTDYLAFYDLNEDEGGDENEGNENEGNEGEGNGNANQEPATNNTQAPTVTEAPATSAPTDTAPVAAEEEGCQSVAGTGAVLALLTLVSLGTLAIRKKD